MRILLPLLLFCGLGFAQNRSAVVNVTSDPSGACSPSNRPADPIEYNITNGSMWGCKAHVWTLITGAGGGGSVTTISGSGPSWLTWTIANPTTTPAITLSATTGQSSHQVIGTCNALTAFAPCALVAGDLPSTAVTPGSYTSTNITVDQQGRITAAASGASAGVTISGWYLTDGVNYYSGPHFAPMTLPIAGNFAWINQNTATEAVNGNALILTATTAGDQINIRQQAIGGNTTLTTHLACTAKVQNFLACGIGFRESSSGKLELINFRLSGTSPWGEVDVIRYSSPTVFTNIPYSSPVSYYQSQWIPFRIIYTTGAPGTVTFQTSSDDTTWVTIFTEASNVAFTTGPDNWFYYVNPNNNAGSGSAIATLYDWKMQ